MAMTAAVQAEATIITVAGPGGGNNHNGGSPGGGDDHNGGEVPGGGSNHNGGSPGGGNNHDVAVQAEATIMTAVDPGGGNNHDGGRSRRR